MTQHLLGDPHHDGSALHVGTQAPSLGDRVPVRVRVPASVPERAVHVRTVRDGEPGLQPLRLDRTDEHERWYVGEVEVHNPVTPYRFLLDIPGGYQWLNGRGLHGRDVSDAGDFRLTTHGSAPAWSRDAVVYQVFPDRFARSGVERPVPDWAEPAAWDDEPVFRGSSTPRQLYGGDLLGIEQRLDHLERLGVDVLYLTPFFPSRSNHRYDASSFHHVDPVLGGDEGLASLSREVHARGMRLMGDLTTNHTGVGHEWFRSAQEDPGSPERDFFFWTDREAHGYVGWLGHSSLPKLDYSAPGLAERLADGPDSVIARWLSEPYALDGWRIDVANMTGRYRDQDLNHAVASRVRHALEAARSDALLISEHFHDASLDLRGDTWHANMNYNGFTRPVWQWLVPPGEGTQMIGLPVPMPRQRASTMVEAMREFDSAVPWKVTEHQWNMLGSHDTARVRTLLGSPAAVEIAVALLMTYPGTPFIFAGDEIGAQGTTGEHARVTMPWDDPSRWDARTFETYRELIALRRSSLALRAGGLRWAFTDDDAVGFLRETPDERVLVVLARAAWSGLSLPAWLADGVPEPLYGSLELRRDAGGALLVPGDGPAVGVWRLS